MVMDSAALAYITAAGYDTYVEQMKEEYGRLGPDQGWEDFSCEIIQRQFAGETVSGLKSNFTYSGIKVFQTQVYYLNGDYVDICTVTSYLTDNGDSVLEQFYRMIN